MSTIFGQRRVEVAPPPAESAVLSVVIEWSISDTRAHARDRTLRWVLESGGRASRAVVIGSDGSERTLAVIEEPCRVLRDGDLIHADLPARSEEGVPLLAATWRQTDAGPEPLYARTSVLSDLGVAGGCAELVGISVRG